MKPVPHGRPQPLARPRRVCAGAWIFLASWEGQPIVRAGRQARGLVAWFTKTPKRSDSTTIAVSEELTEKVSFNHSLRPPYRQYPRRGQSARICAQGRSRKQGLRCFADDRVDLNEARRNRISSMTAQAQATSRRRECSSSTSPEPSGKSRFEARFAGQRLGFGGARTTGRR